MKAALVIADNIKQVMLTPENDAEKQILGLFRIHSQVLEVDFKIGNFYGRHTPPSAHGYRVTQCEGGWLRAYEDADSLMIVIRPKETHPKHPHHETMALRDTLGVSMAELTPPDGVEP